jgi:hypothetical protein
MITTTSNSHPYNMINHKRHKPETNIDLEKKNLYLKFAGGLRGDMAF